MYVMPYLSNQRFDYGSDLVTTNSPAIVVGMGVWTPRDECHFEIDLGKFGLSVFASVFVAETLGELVIFVNSA